MSLEVSNGNIEQSDNEKLELEMKLLMAQAEQQLQGIAAQVNLEVLKRAYMKGHERGYNEGYADGYDVGQKEE